MAEKLKDRVQSGGPAKNPETSSHIPVKQLYTPVDLKGWDQEGEVGYPGEYPFTRGVQATMYRGRLWTMRQYAGMGDAEESNKRYKYLLANGTTGLSVAFDLPTQIGSTPTILFRWAKWGKWALPSIRLRTWNGCSRGLISPRYLHR